MSQAIAWGRVAIHARERIEELRTALEQVEPDKVSPLQAEIRVWRQVIDLPDALNAEPIDDAARYN